MKHFFLSDTKSCRANWLRATILLLLLSSLASAQGRLKVQPDNPRAGASSLYRFDFVLTDSLPSKGAISIVFPKGFDLSRILIAASSAINGGLSPERIGQEVIVFRGGEGRALAKGEKIDIILSLIKNPAIPAVADLQAFLHDDGAKIRRQLKKRQYLLDQNAPSIRGPVTVSLER